MNPKEAVEFMRANGITHLKLENGIEITLSDLPERMSVSERKDGSTSEPALDKMGKRGMTRQQQLDLYGQVFEADFKE